MMNMKQPRFNSFILLVTICLSLASGCCGLQYQVCDPQNTAYTQNTINPVYARQAKELAASTGKLTVAIQAVIEYPAISQGMSDEQILHYIYTEKPELGLIFSDKKVHFTRIDKYVEVTVYADDQTTALVIDKSSTPVIDCIYGSKAIQAE
ncbi:MAG: hypothetical protein FWF12_07170 [Betaproteobacteria bacterium]|nr:hypothetical protein [Betaproteobacteria bacterium]